jgi:hypothetical protein
MVEQILNRTRAAIKAAEIAGAQKTARVALYPDKIFVSVKKGVYIIPADNSYLRFVGNSWYDEETMKQLLK